MVWEIKLSGEKKFEWFDEVFIDLWSQWLRISFMGKDLQKTT